MKIDTKKEKKIKVNKKEQEIEPKWYIFRVQTGREDGIVNSLKSSFSILAKDGIKGEDFFKDFSVPKHNVIKYVNGKRIEKSVNAYPGYVFLRIRLTDEVILFLRNFFRNNGFGQILPQPITDAEYNKMIDKVNGLSKDNNGFVFRIGQRVKIISGSFATMEGNILSIDEKNRKLVIGVMIFNCETNIDVDYNQVTVLD